MPSKYDTNPLDPDFPEKVRAEREAEMATQVLPSAGAETRSFGSPAEDATRRFAPDITKTYSAPITAGGGNALYQNVSPGNVDQSIERKVAKIGLPENIVTAVPYIPWFFGLVAGIIILILAPKSEAKVRFHAAQGLAAHIAIFAVLVLLAFISSFTDLASYGESIFKLVSSILLVVFAYKAFRGKPIHIESIEDLTNFLEDKIGPVKT